MNTNESELFGSSVEATTLVTTTLHIPPTPTISSPSSATTSTTNTCPSSSSIHTPTSAVNQSAPETTTTKTHKNKRKTTDSNVPNKSAKTKSTTYTSKESTSASGPTSKTLPVVNSSENNFNPSGSDSEQTLINASSNSSSVELDNPTGDQVSICPTEEAEEAELLPPNQEGGHKTLQEKNRSKVIKVDMKAKLERSRQSARECRARKKLRYQYLEELVNKKERAVLALRQELDMVNLIFLLVRQLKII